MAILKYILIFLEVLLIFNLLIFVHELGHFLAARWRGLKVDRFAIWFGKPIWKKKIMRTERHGSLPSRVVMSPKRGFSWSMAPFQPRAGTAENHLCFTQLRTTIVRC